MILKAKIWWQSLKQIFVWIRMLKKLVTRKLSNSCAIQRWNKRPVKEA